ncbi:MAG: hypothetical protein JO154_01240 [Chitinophaga sp.]|uniref:hypothetical protein n=1 Tax=Chitinophaga sp. TaxID=1869181 RepID=UPI0025C1873F|nr:hypothetical protein [Chitinophaga sp.]MBV8251201.1 hypothetical protein [Chitinophaga sp.]
MRFRISLLLLFSIIAALSCKRSRPTSHAFYYWKSSCYSEDADNIAKLRPDNIYLHYFDVIWDERRKMPVPVASPDKYSYSSWSRLQGIKPVVYIENRVFEKLPVDSCAVLARKVAAKIRALNRQLNMQGIITEMQFDCDWTASTQKQYFTFLQAFRANEVYKTISATIRLYPYKYQQRMGVPPVDRGMLMCYNLNSINNPDVNNSIIMQEEVKRYITGKTVYPLPLDLAFPVFGWYAWFRNNEFQQIIYGDASLAEDTSVFHPVIANNFISKLDTVMDNHYIREGDVLRREYAQPAELQEIIRYVTGKIPNYETIAFYHWNTPNMNKYAPLIQETFYRY